MITVFDSKTSMAIATLDGKVDYRMEIVPWWNGTEVVTASSSDSQFCIYDTGYTRWNKILHWYDIEDSRSRNFERLVIVETNSGKKRFELDDDPRPFIGFPVVPALSPNGRRIARIYRGELQVFDVQ